MAKNKFRKGQIVVTKEKINASCSGFEWPKGTPLKIMDIDGPDEETYAPYNVIDKNRRDYYLDANQLDIASPKEKAEFK
jgi:hypothetical protein